MRRLIRAAAPEINEKPDQQIRAAHQILVDQNAIQRLLSHHEADRDFDASALHAIRRLQPRADANQHLRDILGLLDGYAFDGQHAVAGMDSCIRSGSACFHPESFDSGRSIHPHHSVFWETKPVLLLEVNERSNRRREREDSEDRGGELKLELLKHSGCRSACERDNNPAVYNARLMPVRKHAKLYTD